MTSFPGVSSKQTMNQHKDSEQVISRRVLRLSWNNFFVQQDINGHGRVIDGFRAANNLGDYLSRPYYACGVQNDPIPRRRPGWTNRMADSSRCDGTGVPGSSCNPRYVSDTSDYIRYRREREIAQTYNSTKHEPRSSASVNAHSFTAML